MKCQICNGTGKQQADCYWCKGSGHANEFQFDDEKLTCQVYAAVDLFEEMSRFRADVIRLVREVKELTRINPGKRLEYEDNLIQGIAEIRQKARRRIR